MREKTKRSLAEVNLPEDLNRMSRPHAKCNTLIMLLLNTELWKQFIFLQESNKVVNIKFKF